MADRDTNRRIRNDLTSKRSDITHTFWCGGCDSYHYVDRRWTVTEGPMGGPTVRPSILCRSVERCHLFVTDGKVQYLPDCTHTLAGETVDLEEFEEVRRG